MQKINTDDLAEESDASPKGKFAYASKGVSEALGRKPQSLDLNERHPFDVEILRIPAGKIPYPYHSHSAQWEFYHVISGTGAVRHQEGTEPIKAGDAFVFKPGEPHQKKANRPGGNRTRWTAAAAMLLRLALAASFLSAVADRFGWWGAPGTPGVAWGAFEPFLAYTKTLLWFLPASLVPAAGSAATVLDVLLAIGLVVGVGLPVVALASGLLLSNFAILMTIADGAEGPFSYSVWTAAAASFLLATHLPRRVTSYQLTTKSNEAVYKVTRS